MYSRGEQHRVLKSATVQEHTFVFDSIFNPGLQACTVEITEKGSNESSMMMMMMMYLSLRDVDKKDEVENPSRINLKMRRTFGSQISR